MQKLTSAVVLALVVASCGGSDEPSTALTDSASRVGTTTTTSVAVDSAPATTDTASMADDAAPATTNAPPAEPPDGPPAPDFALALADGSSFSLSAAEKPVYMVFWAEW